MANQKNALLIVTFKLIQLSYYFLGRQPGNVSNLKIVLGLLSQVKATLIPHVRKHRMDQCPVVILTECVNYYGSKITSYGKQTLVTLQVKTLSCCHLHS